MNRIAIFAIVFLSFRVALSQSAPTSDAFISSRQPEVERLAEALYSTRLDSSRWVRRSVPRCGSFKHHSFASFDAAPKKSTRFVAIYDLDHAAARSKEKPWEGGIKLLRLKTPTGAPDDTDLASEALLTAFNLAVTQENAVLHSVMDPADEAICLILLAGEEPAVSSAQEDSSEVHAKAPVKIASILIPLAGAPGRLASLKFGPGGAIIEASTAPTIAPQHKP